MGGPPGSAPAPPPPMWMPMPVQAPAASRGIPWPMLSFISRILGFVLLFVGTIVEVAGASIGGGCVTDPTSCGTNYLAGILNYIIVGKILWVLGLFFLGAGAGIKIHWGLQMPASGKPEDVRYVAWDRLANYGILGLSILLMAVILLTVNAWPPIPGGIP